MLAQMARASGYLPIAVDCYADADTQKLAVETVRVASLALVDLQADVEALAQRHSFKWVVYGSGFEHVVESLEFLASRWRLLGNAADLFRGFQDKWNFFHRLAVLNISYPKTEFSPPAGNGWLQKPLRGEGGEGIVVFQPASETGGDCYWQRFVDGDVYSVTFVAAGGVIKVLGFNQQWCKSLDYQRSFIFSGVCNWAPIARRQRRQLESWLNKIINIYPLCGLGSLDFIIQGERCFVLELNARVPASAQLYGKKAFDLHVQACLGLAVLSKTRLRTRPRGYQVVYADIDTLIDATMGWPDWVADRPSPGVIIGAGQPICSIIAGGKNARQVRSRLLARRNYLETLLNTGS